MKKLLVCVLIIAGAITLSSCMKEVEEPTSETTKNATVNTTKEEQSTAEDSRGMTIIINGEEFSVTSEDNESAKAFSNMLPVTLNMSELHGNEKYYYLDTILPSHPQSIGTIHKGDIMLYGDDCIVIFYKDFDTDYKYTRIGHIDNAESLEKQLGNGNIDVVVK